MSSIRLKPYKFIKYRDSKISLFKTRNQKFIKSTCYSNELKRAKLANQPFYIYLSQYEFEPKKKNEHRELKATNFSLTEEEAITVAKRSVDREVGDFAFLKEKNIPTHIYDCETGKVTPRWCPLTTASPYEIGQSIEGYNFTKVTPYYKWQHEYAINYEGYAPAEENAIPYVYINNCLIVTQYRELEGWSIAEPFGVTMSLLKEVRNINTDMMISDI